MPKIKPFVPKTGPEKKLADPGHTEPLLLTYKKNPFGAVLRVESLLGLRFECARDEWNTPLINPNQVKDTAVMLEETYKRFAHTVAELYVRAEDLTLDSARLIFTMPYATAGHRTKGVVGTFSYFPAQDMVSGQEILTLHREKVSDVKGQVPHGYFQPAEATDPSRLRGAGYGAYLQQQGYVGGQSI